MGMARFGMRAVLGAAATAAAGFILSSVAAARPARQTAAATGAALKPFAQAIPGTAAQLDLVPIPAGSVTMAAPGHAPATVAVKPFWIARTETPWEVFDGFTNSGPPSPAYDQKTYPPDAIARPSKSYIPPDMGWGHHGYPVIHESYLSAQMFCRWLSSKTGRKYRLPTEAEWKYAALAGAAAPQRLTPAQLGQRAWYAANSDQQTHPVAKKLPNAWGLYDMLGNVGEWAITSDGKPVLCGGSYADAADHLGPGARAWPTPEWQATDPQIPKSRWWLSDAHFAGFRVVYEP